MRSRVVASRDIDALPVLPVAELKALQRRALQTLRERGGGAPLGDTLTPAFRSRHTTEKASVVMVDSDLYSSTVDVLRFVAPLIQDRAVLFFFDWNSNDLAAKNMGERRAFDEFLAAHLEFTVEDFGTYASHAQCFIVARSHDVTRAR